MSEKPIILIGNGGHANSLVDVILNQGRKIIGFTTPTKEINPYNLSYLGDDDAVFNYQPDKIELVNALGSTENTEVRKQLYHFFKSKAYSFASVIHSSAIISSTVELAEGVQIMAGAVIQPFTVIANNTIINTSVSIDHDCKIGKHCHIAPGTTMSGGVTVGDSTHIGSGATIIQNINIGSNVLVGAASLVLKNIKNDRKAYGVPAKEV